LAEDDSIIPHERMKMSLISELDRLLNSYSEPIIVSSVIIHVINNPVEI